MTDIILRTKKQKLFDFLTFPLRALVLFENNKWHLSSLRSERFDYVAREVKGYCLDVGCGKKNLFIKQILNNNGQGIDVYKYEGLTPKNVVKDLSRFPFKTATFESVTFIANLNHVPKPLRLTELKEAHRVLKKDGNIIVTMGNPLMEILVHKYVFLFDKIFKTNNDMDSERGMEEDEDYYIKDQEIISLLKKAGFKKISKKNFGTQWHINHLILGWKI